MKWSGFKKFGAWILLAATILGLILYLFMNSGYSLTNSSADFSGGWIIVVAMEAFWILIGSVLFLFG